MFVMVFVVETIRIFCDVLLFFSAGLLDCCVLHKELCVVFCKKCFMKCKTESKAELVSGLVQIWCVLLLFEWQLSETVWQVKIVCEADEKTVINENKYDKQNIQSSYIFFLFIYLFITMTTITYPTHKSVWEYHT